MRFNGRLSQADFFSSGVHIDKEIIQLSAFQLNYPYSNDSTIFLLNVTHMIMDYIYSSELNTLNEWTIVVNYPPYQKILFEKEADTKFIYY